MNQFLFVGGEFYEVPTEGAKAITTIPAWAERLNKQQRRTPAANRYMQSPTAYTCVQMRSRALSAIEWQIKTGEESIAPDKHPLKLLFEEVNEDMNWVDLIRATEADMLIHGAAFWLKGRPDGGGKSFFLWRLNPADIKLVTNNQGIVGFEQKIESGREAKMWDREEVIYFHDYHPTEDFKGLAPLDICADAIDVEISTSRFAVATFKNYGIPPIVFETEQPLLPQDFNRIRTWFRRTFTGSQNAGKAAFMDKGLKAKVIGFPIKDLDLEGVRAEARRDICAALSVPPAIAGAWEAANFASATEQHRSLYEDTIIPRAQYIASVLNAEIVPEFGNNLEFEWLFDELPIMQPDRLAEAQRAALLVRDGVIKPLAGAIELGFQEEDAGIGPIQTRIVDEDADVVPGGSNIQEDLGKWMKKSLNSLSKAKGAQVDFESDHIPAGVNQYVFSSLSKCEDKTQVQELFNQFIHL
jgi:HK97 family phage portal protein